MDRNLDLSDIDHEAEKLVVKHGVRAQQVVVDLIVAKIKSRAQKDREIERLQILHDLVQAKTRSI